MNQSTDLNELAAILAEFSGKISVVKSKHPVPIELHIAYMHFHDQVETENLVEKELLKQSKKLFDKSIPIDEKKIILFQLAHLGTLASYQTLGKYLEYAEKEKAEQELIPWTVLCSEECRMFLESDLLGEDTGMLMSPAGGDGANMRYYFIISSDKDIDFTVEQKKIIKEEFKKIAEETKCKIEKIEFGENHALFTALHPFEVAPAELIERGIETCNKSKNFLRFNYYCGNVEKPDKKLIDEYMGELNQRTDLPTNSTYLTSLQEEEVIDALEEGDKIKAIELVQQFTQSDLAASKEYVDELQLGIL